LGVALPSRNKANQVLLRARLPDGWHMTGAKAGDAELPVDAKGTVNLTAFHGILSIDFAVARN
jgi:hypothetical protein